MGTEAPQSTTVDNHVHSKDEFDFTEWTYFGMQEREKHEATYGKWGSWTTEKKKEEQARRDEIKRQKELLKSRLQRQHEATITSLGVSGVLIGVLGLLLIKI